MKQLAALFVLLSFSIVAQAGTFKPYKAKYQVKAMGFTVGKAERELKIDKNNGYVLKLHSWSTSIFVDMDVRESSRGNLTTNQPSAYRFVRKQGDKEKRNNIDFDWKNLTAISEYKDREYILPLHNNTQDKISYQLQMRKDLLAGKVRFRYSLADEKKVEIFEFLIKGHEKIKTKIGKIDTVRLEKVSDKSKRSTTFWLAPKYNYLLVKLEHVERGTSSIILINDLTFA